DALNFLFYKSSIPTVLPAGIPFSYGNPDNYVSLWVLLIPFTAGSLFFIRRPWIAAAVLFALLYLGLFVYSRSGLILISISLTLLLAFRYFSTKSISGTIIAALTALVLIHASRSSIAYYSEGIVSFTSTIESSSSAPPVEKSSKAPPPAKASHPLERDNGHSGEDRATAWAKGLNIGISHWMTGIGYGVYPIIEPELTAPHTMLLLRLAESGIFGLISFLILAMYAPARLVGMLRDRRADIFNVTCLVAVSAFMLKAIFFGASFSISSNIVWGYGVMMLLAASEGKTA
ncbi:MAG: O-antigen ligase family protein, partial [Clostridia bacterium]|nr:O-antigen ligase family protein [Clostridia bacterium]